MSFMMDPLVIKGNEGAWETRARPHELRHLFIVIARCSASAVETPFSLRHLELKRPCRDAMLLDAGASAVAAAIRAVKRMVRAPLPAARAAITDGRRRIMAVGISACRSGS